jgi:branched-chain amino acid transport system permease protein
MRARAYVAGNFGSAMFALLGVIAILYVIYLGIRDPVSLEQTLVIGLADGALFALIALGYTMVYGIIELINFAHGDIFTLSAFVALFLMGLIGIKDGDSLTFVLVLELIGVIALVMVLIGLLNMGIERVAYKPLRHAPRLAPLITAIGMSFLVEGVMYLWKGPFSLRFPDLIPSVSCGVGGYRIGSKDVVVIVAAAILVVLLSLFINRTKLGKAMRATAQDPDAAKLMGINTDRTISATFFIGAALAGAGGVIYGLYLNTVRFDLGFSAGLVAFTAAVFGGIGNIEGAALGGVLIGLIRALNESNFSGNWSDVVIFGILILVLVFRPSGLLGMRVPEK